MMLPLVIASLWCCLVAVLTTAVQRRRWRKEDKAFQRSADYMLDAAKRGVDTSWLDDCPDVTRLNFPRSTE